MRALTLHLKILITILVVLGIAVMCFNLLA